MGNLNFRLKSKVLSPIFILKLLATNLKPTKRSKKIYFRERPTDDELFITYVGHSTALIMGDGFSFLTDPVFSKRIWIIKRDKAPGISIKDLPKLDFVLISHAHFDHLDLKSLKKLPKDLLIITPKGVGDILKKAGFSNVIELCHWQDIQILDLKITATPVKHDGARFVFDTFREACGYIIETNSGNIYFSGDTAYFSGFSEIGKRVKINVCLLPIGAYRPDSLLSFHMGPKEAVSAFLDLKADYMIPIHWGTFPLSWEGVDAPLDLLDKVVKEKGISDRVVLLKPGETARFRNVLIAFGNTYCF